MPSPYIEQLRQQFYASLGINEYTPISDADAPGLIDQWEQYLVSAAQQSGGYSGYPNYPGGSPYQSAPFPRTTMPSYVPPGQRTAYQPGQIYNVGGGTYVGPPTPGSVVGPRSVTTIPGRPGTATPITSATPVRPVTAPVYTATGTPGAVQMAPPPRR